MRWCANRNDLQQHVGTGEVSEPRLPALVRASRQSTKSGARLSPKLVPVSHPDNQWGVVMRIRTLPVSIILGAAALLVGFTAGAETVSINPSMVVSDNNGAVVGPVIGFATNGRPEVLINDTTQPGNMPRGVIIRVEKNGLSTEDDFEVYYSATGCTGTPYLKPASERSGLAEMTDINYSVGLNGSDTVLYKASGGGTTTSYQSFYRSTTLSCTDSSGSRSLVAATQVMNITNDHPPPYGVTFPGL